MLIFTGLRPGHLKWLRKSSLYFCVASLSGIILCRSEIYWDFLYFRENWTKAEYCAGLSHPSCDQNRDRDTATTRQRRTSSTASQRFSLDTTNSVFRCTKTIKPHLFPVVRRLRGEIGLKSALSRELSVDSTGAKQLSWSCSLYGQANMRQNFWTILSFVNSDLFPRGLWRRHPLVYVLVFKKNIVAGILVCFVLVLLICLFNMWIYIVW